MNPRVRRQGGFVLTELLLVLGLCLGLVLALLPCLSRWQELANGFRLLEEGEDPPFPDPEWETETVLEPVPQLPGVMLRKICLTRRGKGRCCYARYEKK